MAISELKIKVQRRWFATPDVYVCLVAVYFGADADKLAEWISRHCFRYGAK